jgi:hypothetical protein
LLCFPFLGMIEFAHDLTLRGLRLLLRVEDFDFSVSSANSTFSTEGEGKEASKERERVGSDLQVGRLWPRLSLRFDSRRKKLRRLALRRGELAASVGDSGDIGEIADMGLLRLECSPARGLPMKLSNIAPAVLGRPSSSTVLSDGRPIREGCGLELLPPTIDDKLLVAE